MLFAKVPFFIKYSKLQKSREGGQKIFQNIDYKKMSVYKLF